MKKHFKKLLPITAILLVVLCVSTIILVTNIQSYSKLINYLGLVRGTSQRLVKLELSGTKSDDLIAYIDGILQELNTGDGKIGLVKITDSTYKSELTSLTEMWKHMKDGISNIRQGDSDNELISKSEDFFRLANETVFSAEIFSNKQTQLLLVLIIFMIFFIIFAWFVIIRAYIKHTKSLENANNDLNKIVYTDALTGSPNLTRFQNFAQELLDTSQMPKYAIFYLDFDNFKYYNDVFGIAYGDELLCTYVKFLLSDMREDEIFCRVSSDYFLVLRKYDNKDDLIKRQEIVDEKIAQYVLESKEQHLFTVSCGICCTEDLPDYQQITNLIERANFARKTVKNQGVTHYAFYNESIRDKMLNEKAIENKMYSALENEEFAVYLQPKVCLSNNKIACAEALIRWIPGDGHIIPPNEFIPVFEKNMFISRLDQFVVEKVCQWMRQRLDRNLHVIPVSVNVSRMQLYDPDFVKTYAAIKNKYNIPEKFIEVEFTESMVFENLNAFLNIIHSLKREGFLCSLDDFGKGYSSLNLLRNLPVDVLKLDKMFFDEDDAEDKAKTIVAGIISLVKMLKIEIVAEGVEKKSQVEFLRELGCDLVQGYAFYRPMPLYEADILLDIDADAVANNA